MHAATLTCIKRLLRTGLTQREVAKRVRVSRSTVRRVASREYVDPAAEAHERGMKAKRRRLQGLRVVGFCPANGLQDCPRCGVRCYLPEIKGAPCVACQGETIAALRCGEEVADVAIHDGHVVYQQRKEER